MICPGIRGWLIPACLFLLFPLIWGLISCAGNSKVHSEDPPVKTLTETVSGIQEPDFSINSIVILQAELINTRLKVGLHISNANPFPVTLSSFRYKLYAAGRFWAEGTERNVCIVPASDFLEKDILLVMNFIEMRRNLLDTIIAMNKVPYRFEGTAYIEAQAVPGFTMNFVHQGEAEVNR